MKKLILSFIVALFTTIMFAQKTTHVKTYRKKDGTVVEHHDRSKSNKTKNDNWSTKGNINPETGKKGTKTPKK